MQKDSIAVLKRALQREKAARKEAEKILETKSRELYYLSKELQTSNSKLKKLLNAKSSELQVFFDNIIDAYVVIDLNGKIVKYNKPAIDLFGFDKDKDISDVFELVPKEDLEHAQASFFELFTKGEFKNYEGRVYSKDNSIKWVQINASVIYDEEHNPIAAQGILRDITSDKEAEDLLIESENRLASLITNLDSAVLLEDENRHILLTNTKFCNLFKIPVAPSELKGQDCSNAAENSKHLFTNSNAFVKRINQIVKQKQQVIADEITMTDGTVLERDFIPILKNNIYKGHLWTYRNVTLKKQYHKSLETQKQKYSNIIANMNLGLVEVNTKDAIVMVNQSFCDMSGYKETDLIDKSYKQLFKSSDKEQLKKLNKPSTFSTSFEFTVTNKNGDLRHWLISKTPNYNLKQEATGCIIIHLDITDFKLLEQQKEAIRSQLEKSNNDLQEYAHIVSHDLKSPLRSLNALFTWIKEDNKDKFDALTLQNFKLVDTTLQSMEHLISDVLEYSRAGSQSEILEDVNLKDILIKLTKVLYVPEHITINLPKTLPIIKADKVKMQQLFQNLISNAIKFIDKDKGIVDVGFKDQDSYYLFFIKDNGIGIDKKYHNTIFKIFQSLNKSTESTGIGLSIVKKIIDLYNGNIWLESTPGKGTTFYFTLKK